MQSYRGQNFRGDIEGNLRHDNSGKVEVGLEKDSFPVILEEMSKGVVGPNQVREPILIEIGLDALIRRLQKIRES